jgi:hypothetical protein
MNSVLLVRVEEALNAKGPARRMVCVVETFVLTAYRAGFTMKREWSCPYGTAQGRAAGWLPSDTLSACGRTDSAREVATEEFTHQTFYVPMLIWARFAVDSAHDRLLFLRVDDGVEPDWL